MTLDEFKELMPAEMREHLLSLPLMGVWVARLRETPADTEEALQMHIAWFKAKLREEQPDFSPESQDPNDMVIKVMISLAQEKIAALDGAQVVFPGTTRH